MNFSNLLLKGQIAYDLAVGFLSFLANGINHAFTAKSYMETKSLSEAAKLTRVEPLTIISDSCVNLEYMVDINQSILSIFAAYYLQAVNILTKINSVEVVRVLDKLNPDRDMTGFLAENRLSTESISNKELYVANNYRYKLPTKRLSIATEVGDSKSAISMINEISNLSVGKMLEIEIPYMTNQDQGTRSGVGVNITVNSGKQEFVKLPVNIRLIVSSISSRAICHLLALKKEDEDISARFHSWRSGRISFIKDLIYCQDLIMEYRKAIIKDETNTIDEIVRRVNSAKKFGLLTHNPSLASASNIFVISDTDKIALESALGGKLANPHIRQKAFDNTYAMIIVVVDKMAERVTFYIRGVSGATDLSIKEIKSCNKNKGPDIADMLKLLNAGNPISF